MITENMNVELFESTMSRVVLHHVGNKAKDEGINIAKEELDIDADMTALLFDFFAKGLNCDELFYFTHEHDLSMNEIYNACTQIFDNPEELLKGSVKIARALYDVGDNPKVKGGELYVAHFVSCLVDGEEVDGIGIFKTEKKGSFLDLSSSDGGWVVDVKEGTDTAKLDKGCLVLNVCGEEGYRIANLNLTGAQAKLWNKEFLSISRVQDSAFHTKEYMQMCNSFAKKAFKEDGVDKRVEFLNTTKDYFTHYKEFDEKEFKELVFETADLEKQEQFEEFKNEYQENIDIEDTAEEPFVIEKGVASKIGKKLKGTITLDTNMTINVNSSEAHADEYIVKGYDEEREMNYYKVYFNLEK
jgi:hypothetical protein